MIDNIKLLVDKCVADEEDNKLCKGALQEVIRHPQDS